MAPVKVIVQGISLRYDDGYQSESCPNQGKRKLEQVLASYGPVKCTYSWTDANADSGPPRAAIADNFAHVFFKNYEDSVRACQAAENHQLRLEDCILTLTPVPNALVPIANLTDDCLIKIFSKLDIKDKLKIEEVCEQWAELVQYSWSSTTKLDLTHCTITEKQFQTYLMKCGRYLEEFSGIMKTIFFLQLIEIYCKKIQILDLTIDIDELDPKLWQEALTKLLLKFDNLESLKLRHDFWEPYDVLNYISNSVKSLTIVASFQMDVSSVFDFTNFHNLRHITVDGYVVTELEGLENLRNLTHLDLSHCRLSRHAVDKIEKLSKLKIFKISYCNMDHVDISDDVLIRMIRDLGEIECLWIDGMCSLTDRSLQFISTLPNLKSLNISDLHNVTLHSMGEMPSMVTLECEDLDTVTDEGMARLIKLAPNLKRLNISHSSITPNFFTIADSIVKTRTSNNALIIITSEYSVTQKTQGFSPLLKLQFNGKVSSILGDRIWTRPHAPGDDLYDDVNENDDYGICGEDSDSFDDDRGFEMY